MLRAGGADVVVAGFRRSADPVTAVAQSSAVDFGRTYNSGFAQRIWSVLRAGFLLKRHKSLFTDTDVILARNLEMLALGVQGRRFSKKPAILIYECLDIHRLLLNEGITGFVMRRLEGWLGRRASALFTSSPAFISHYFQKLSQIKLPIRLVENRVLDTGGHQPPLSARNPGSPWIIGWFGMIRCRKSLDILSDLVRKSDGRVEVIIRGRPDRNQFDDFDKSVGQVPGLRFAGPYLSPDDLPSLYGNVHFSWAIDMFEEGLNSSWLLPNRLYEGGLFGAVPIALQSVETGRFLERLGIGVRLKEPLADSLASFFKDLSAGQYAALEKAVLDIPRTAWICDKSDCLNLIDYMRSLKGQ